MAVVGSALGAAALRELAARGPRLRSGERVSSPACATSRARLSTDFAALRASSGDAKPAAARSVSVDPARVSLGLRANSSATPRASSAALAAA